MTLDQIIIAARAVERAASAAALLGGAYSKPQRFAFQKLEDNLKLDDIKPPLEHGL